MDPPKPLETPALPTAVPFRGSPRATVEDAGGAQPFVQQTNETDWAFLWRLARRVGCEVEVADGALH